MDQPFFAASGYLSGEPLEVVTRSIAGPTFSSLHEQQPSTSYAIAPQYALLLAFLALLSPSPISLRTLSSNFQTSILPSITRRAISSVSSLLEDLAGYPGLTWTLLEAHVCRPILAIFKNKRVYCRYQKSFYSTKQLSKRLAIVTTGVLLVSLSQIVGLRKALAIGALLSIYLQALLRRKPRNCLRQDYSDVKAGLLFVMAGVCVTGAIPLPNMIILAGGLAAAFQFEVNVRKMHWEGYLRLYHSMIRREDTGIKL